MKVISFQTNKNQITRQKHFHSKTTQFQDFFMQTWSEHCFTGCEKKSSKMLNQEYLFLSFITLHLTRTKEFCLTGFRLSYSLFKLLYSHTWIQINHTPNCFILIFAEGFLISQIWSTKNHYIYSFFRKVCKGKIERWKLYSKSIRIRKHGSCLKSKVTKSIRF